MAKFFDDISDFYGTEKYNEKGEDLETFLEHYNPYQYKNPCVTTDILVFHQVFDDKMSLLMIKRRNHPCIGRWALPGGFAEIEEDLIDTAKRELKEETGLDNIPMEQLYTWGESKRDPRARIITTSFLAYVTKDIIVQAGDDAKDAQWFDIDVQMIAEEESERTIKTIYQITMTNKDVEHSLHAKVSVTRAKGILPEYSYTIEEHGEIAFDHARMIVQGYLYLESKKRAVTQK